MLAVITDDLRHKVPAFAPVEASHSYEHPRNLNRILCDGVELGTIGVAHPETAARIDKKAAIVFAELDVQAFACIADAGIAYREPSRFPEIEVDLSFVSDTFAPIAAAIERADCALIRNVEVVDTYQDAAGKSITTRLTFAHPERTLTREEVMAVADGIIESLASENIPLKK